MTRVMVLLVGEQPVPNLLPARHLQPDVILLVHSKLTRMIAERLQALLKAKADCQLHEVDPYDVSRIEAELTACTDQFGPSDELILNLTGGTKPMALAGLEVARRRHCRFVYFQSERNVSRLQFYDFDEDHVKLVAEEDLPETITLDDYLRCHLGAYEEGEPRNAFERDVADALRADARVSEVKTSVRRRGIGALEIDFVVRCGNQVGVGEVKTKGAKDGIDQISAVTRPDHLGTYVHKFLISGTEVDPNNRELAKAYGIQIVEERDRPRIADEIVRKLIHNGERRAGRP